MKTLSHADCSIHDPCEHGAPAECPPQQAKARRDATGRPWSPLECRRDAGGFRHYLDGRAIHCGETIELQSVASTTDDYGIYDRRLPTGTVVRYEASQDSEGISATLYADIGGHEFVAGLEKWHRFRWPR